MKIPYINSELFFLVQKTEIQNDDFFHIKKENVILTKARSCTIPYNFVGHIIGIHNGTKFKRTHITKNMVGYKLGQFVFTKKLGSSIHNSDRNKKKVEKMRRKITQKKIRRPTSTNKKTKKTKNKKK